MQHCVIISCEHASCHVPPAFKSLFRGQGEVLRSHRGYDPHSIEMATALAKQLKCKLFQGTTTRLLVEINRSLGHPKLFSAFTRSLSKPEQTSILNEYYIPYRTAVESEIRSNLRKRRTVLHLSIHTFTPVYDGKPRTADVGLLYDPARDGEAALMKIWQRQLSQQLPELRTRRNYPYQGRSDGFTTALRKKFAAADYLGIEIEVRNSLRPASVAWRKLAEVFVSLTREYCAGKW